MAPIPRDFGMVESDPLVGSPARKPTGRRAAASAAVVLLCVVGGCLANNLLPEGLGAAEPEVASTGAESQ